MFENLESLFNFLDLECEDDFYKNCKNVLFKKPNKRSDSILSEKEKKEIKEIKERSQEYKWLTKYNY